MKKITSILLIFVMLFSAFSLTGCPDTPTPIRMSLTSETTVFSIDNVVLDLAYGFHELTFWGAVSKKPKENYPFMQMESDYVSTQIDFAMYIYPITSENEHKIYDYSDMENVEDHIFIKKISEKEAFSKEYGYKNKINHCEQIKIPPELMTEDYRYKENVGIIRIVLMAFYTNLETGNSMPLPYSDMLAETFVYRVIDENKIEIEIL